MAQVTNFFVGANSGEGFRNLFSELVDVEDTYDFMVLKGGPGVGKNTFMREIGRCAEAAGLAVDDKLDFDTAKILIAAYREAQKKMEVE